MEQLASLAQLVERAKQIKGKCIVIPAAETSSALGAAIEARKHNLARAILIGDKNNLQNMLQKADENPNDYEIIHEPDDVLAAQKAVALVRSNNAQIILKGRLKTGDLLRAVLNRDNGLRTGNLLSDVLISENPASIVPKIIGLSDGGLNVAPDLQAKKQIIENSVKVFHRLGFVCPKVAILCALEEPTESMPHTIDAQKLTQMNLDGEITGCTVFGPLALDNAISMEAAKIKGVTHPVAGQADILIVPNIEAGNGIGKAFIYFAKKSVGHVTLGAKAPILIPSRAETAQDKLLSIAMGVLCSEGSEA